MRSLKLLTWNLSFASRKRTFVSDDKERAQVIARIISTQSPDIVALQEVANRIYVDGRIFNLSDYLIQQMTGYKIYFHKALSLPTQHSNPYGKAKLLEKEFAIHSHEQGIGLLYRTNSSKLKLSNLYSLDKGEANIEVTHPLPQSLYMGSEIDENSAGRDDEDRPALWSRWKIKDFGMIKLFFVSLHLPTLKGERSNNIDYSFTSRQIEIRDVILNQPYITNINELGAELRCYYLRGIISQCERLENYWKIKDSNSKIWFILAGDFNFNHLVDTKERKLLQSSRFIMSQAIGSSKESGMLLDNIWIRSDNGTEVKAEILSDLNLYSLSDHLPINIELMW
jgi:endonuclease/exonuclease/phosphatase family metal-dependent hydrolase